MKIIINFVIKREHTMQSPELERERDWQKRKKRSTEKQKEKKIISTAFMCNSLPPKQYAMVFESICIIYGIFFDVPYNCVTFERFPSYYLRQTYQKHIIYLFRNKENKTKK